MVRLIMSGSGEGKTKQLLDLMNTAAETAKGCLVCIEPKRNMSFNLHHQTRLIDASEFEIDSFDTLRGFLSGLYAGNYDISDIFIDNLCKVAHNSENRDIDAFLTWLDKFTSQNKLRATVTISAATDSATETMQKFM